MGRLPRCTLAAYLRRAETIWYRKASLAKDALDRWVDMQDALACSLHVGGDKVAWLHRIVGKPNEGDGFSREHALDYTGVVDA